MPTLCCIVSCGNKQRKGLKTRFFRIPAVINSEGERALELSEKRRRLWFAAVNREDSKWKKVEGWRVCSDHFISGSPASLFDENNPDWVPSLNLGYERAGCSWSSSPDCSSGTKAACERYERAKRRKEAIEEEETRGGHTSPLNVELMLVESNSEKPVQENSHMIDVERQLITLKEENKHLKDEIEKLKKAARGFKNIEERDFKDDNRVLYYTGLPTYGVMMATFNLISPGISERPNAALSKFQKFVMTMMRLRLNLQVQDLAFRFNVSLSVVSRAFTEIIDLLYQNLKSLIYWPNREDIRKSMPMIFRENYGKRVIGIIDCFEVFIERPSNMYARAQTWSNYKHHNTVKYLIGITPQGSISFISGGWGGRASDKHVTMQSKYCKNLLPGDIVLADRGFDIDEVVAMEGAQLKIPAFTKGKKQLSGREVEGTRNIANVRIHVERVIGLLRQKYTMLQSVIPINFVTAKTQGESPMLDKVVVVACGLTNLCPSVVPFE